MRHPELNVRVLSLNTNHAYLLNWFTFLNKPREGEAYDPDGMFSWMVNELHAAELAGT